MVGDASKPDEEESTSPSSPQLAAKVLPDFLCNLNERRCYVSSSDSETEPLEDESRAEAQEYEKLVENYRGTKKNRLNMNSEKDDYDSRAGEDTSTGNSSSCEQQSKNRRQESTYPPKSDCVEIRKDSKCKSWKQRYEELLEYKKRFGNCNVPHSYVDNPALASWVKWQRYYKSKGVLALERLEQLDSIGFQWKRRFKHETSEEIS